ncbi:MAG: hypothetical protein Q7K03_10180 [Dehalococcoidia bacterium]|nr:hypothetical protein [Dehalococcoidia bacterium]
MKAKRIGLLVGLLGLLAIVAATTMAVGRPSAQGAPAAKKEAVLQFSVTIGDPDFDLLRAIGDPDFDLLKAVEGAIRRGANIGSSGQDGFSVESFFDIEYQIKKGGTDFGLPSPGHTTLTVVMHATPNGPVDPVVVITNVQNALDKELDKMQPKKEREFAGHVTLIK